MDKNIIYVTADEKDIRHEPWMSEKRIFVFYKGKARFGVVSVNTVSGELEVEIYSPFEDPKEAEIVTPKGMVYQRPGKYLGNHFIFVDPKDLEIVIDKEAKLKLEFDHLFWYEEIKKLKSLNPDFDL